MQAERPLQLVLLRHGATAGNERRCYVGCQTDEPLSEAGRAQCEAAGVYPEITRVFTSPMQRAQQTAQICFPRAEITVVQGLEEYDFGSFEGRTASEMADDADYRAWVNSGCTAACPGGDSRASYLERSNNALLDVLRETEAAGKTQAIFVAHGGTIMAAMHAFAVDSQGTRIDKTDLDYFNWQVKNAQGYTAEVHFTSQGLVLSKPQNFVRLPL